MTQVFLSYDREDRAAAGRIASELESAGHDVWWDRQIRGGAEYATEIEQALEAADAVVVLWSKRSIASSWVRDEAAAGRDRGRFVPVRIDGCTPPLGFRQFQTIELQKIGRSGSKDALSQLDSAVRALSPDRVASVKPFVPEPSDSRLTRRKLLIGGGALAVGAAAGGSYLFLERRRDREAPAEVRPLLAQAKQLMNQDSRDQQSQALALYQRVTQVAPDYADGWGWLGYTYGVFSHFRPRQEALLLRARAEAAGQHALELDADSPMGELALSVALPLIGYWAERERRLLRALSIDPHNDEVLLLLAVAELFAGRASEAVRLFKRISHSPLNPAEYTNYMNGLWEAGRLPELDQAMNDATSLYPAQESTWFARLNIAMYAGDVPKVRALAEDKQGRPANISDEATASFVRLTEAIERRDPEKVDAEAALQIEEGRKSAERAGRSIRNLSALGRLDDAFAMANAYYFGRGFTIPDSTQSGTEFSPEQRWTELLFEPETKAMRADRRFEALVADLGLDRYWRSSGRPPDYRRAAGL